MDLDHFMVMVLQFSCDFDLRWTRLDFVGFKSTPCVFILGPGWKWRTTGACLLVAQWKFRRVSRNLPCLPVQVAHWNTYLYSVKSSHIAKLRVSRVKMYYLPTGRHMQGCGYMLLLQGKGDESDDEGNELTDAKKFSWGWLRIKLLTKMCINVYFLN